MRKPGLTTEQKLERAKTATEAVRSTEGFMNWMRVRRQFRRYSARNQWLIASQCPDAQIVLPAYKWRKLGFFPAKGSKAAYVWAPHKLKAKEGEGSPTPPKKERLGFHLAPVFADSQVAPFDPDAELPVVPYTPTHEPGDPVVRAQLVGLAVTLGFTVEFVDRPGCEGSCNHTTKTITVGAEHIDTDHGLRVLIHEIAHAHGITYKTHDRKLAEQLVETIVFIVCETTGLATTSSRVASATYIAAWSDPEYDLTEHIKEIDPICRAFEQAILGDPHDPLASEADAIVSGSSDQEDAGNGNRSRRPQGRQAQGRSERPARHRPQDRPRQADRQEAGA